MRTAHHHVHHLRTIMCVLCVYDSVTIYDGVVCTVFSHSLISHLLNELCFSFTPIARRHLFTHSVILSPTTLIKRLCCCFFSRSFCVCFTQKRSFLMHYTYNNITKVHMDKKWQKCGFCSLNAHSDDDSMLDIIRLHLIYVPMCCVFVLLSLSVCLSVSK